MTDRVIFRCTPAQRLRLEAAAAAAGERLSDYLRDALDEQTKQDLVGRSESKDAR